jgi:hypothetical protein
MGLISTVALFLPIALILVLKLGLYRTFPALLFYYFIAFTNNCLEQGYISVGKDVVKYWGLTNNLLDAPVMLLFLTYFCTSAIQARKMRILILSFILFEILVVLIKGYNKEAITIILAPGLAIIFGFCLSSFVRLTKMAITHSKATGKAVIIASIVFAYGCFSLIYLMFYVFQTHIEGNIINQQYVADTYLIYFFAATLSSLLLSVGIIIESKRVQKLNELKITRKELSMIYKGTERPTRIGVLLDFDRD